MRHNWRWGHKNQQVEHETSVLSTVMWTHHGTNDDGYSDGEDEEWHSQLVEQCKAREDVLRCE